MTSFNWVAALHLVEQLRELWDADGGVELEEGADGGQHRLLLHLRQEELELQPVRLRIDSYITRIIQRKSLSCSRYA